MVTIFVSHIEENAEFAEQIREELEAHSYTVWRKPASLTIESVSYQGTIENAILGSAAIVLVWSSNAEQSEWIERNTVFAQKLKKPIFPIVLDDTSLPSTLVSVKSISGRPSGAAAFASLVSQSSFPIAHSSDPLFKLYEQAAHRFIRERRAAIDQAAGMLQRAEHKEAVLALLEYLASNDLIKEVRDKAQEILNTTEQKKEPSPVANQSRHIFGVRCDKCGHITYFNKQHVCTDYVNFPRKGIKRAGEEVDELRLTCEQCREDLVALVDCRGYK